MATLVLVKSLRASSNFTSLPLSARHCKEPLCMKHFIISGMHTQVSACSISDTVKRFGASDYGVFYKQKPRIHNHVLLPSRRNLLENSSPMSFSAIQVRNFSLRDTLDSTLATHSSIFKSISESTIVQYSQNTIIQFHEYTGLPWWLSIILTTFIVRGVLTLPVALYQNHVIAKLENARLEMDAFVNDLKYDLNREVRKGKRTEEMAKRHFNETVRKEWNRLVLRDNCHPAKVAILAIVQIPLWVTLSTAFRNMVYMLPVGDFQAQLIRLELTTGGFLWCPDLCLPDSFGLPIALGLTNLLIIEIQTMIHKNKGTKLQRYLTNFFRGFCVFMIPVAASVPSVYLRKHNLYFRRSQLYLDGRVLEIQIKLSQIQATLSQIHLEKCLTLYWLSSSVFGLAQNLIVLSPRLRRIAGIPTTPSTIPKPYSHIAKRVRHRLGL